MLAGLCLWAWSCATPTGPTGGPADKEGPEIVETHPETGTVNFDGREIGLEFSEFVDRNSLNNAITIEPDVGLSYSLNWGRKSVAIEFASSLPELTTIIVTIGTELRDVNGNKLAAPRKIAVSTGPEIDEGSLRGKILDAQTGKGDEGQRVLLYRTPFDLSQKADYIAETDTSGTFQFSYLRQGEYKAFWLDDRNRNKIWDRERERAQPFLRETVTLEKAESDTLSPLYLAPADTVSPELQGVGLFSSRRLRLRFSENITLREQTTVSITDTLGAQASEAYPLYIPPNDPYVLFVQSREALASEQSYLMQVKHISDLLGNITDSTAYRFTGSSQQDTTEQRVVGRRYSAGIYPDEAIEVIYAAPVERGPALDSLKIVKGTELLTDNRGLEAVRNRLMIKPEGRWEQGLDYELRIWDPIQTDYIAFSPEIWFENRQGKLNIILEDTISAATDNSNIITLKVESGERGVMADTTFSGSVTVDQLPPISYTVKAFRDRNGNGKWDHGIVDPFRAPEPYVVRTDIPVKSGFTADLSIDLPRMPSASSTSASSSN